jgi:hypothetical protein
MLTILSQVVLATLEEAQKLLDEPLASIVG